MRSSNATCSSTLRAMDPHALPVLFERALASGRLHSAYLISGPRDAGARRRPGVRARERLRARNACARSCAGCRRSSTARGDRDRRHRPQRSAVPADRRPSRPVLGRARRRGHARADRTDPRAPARAAPVGGEGGRRVAVIADAEWLNQEAQNALLRLLEEPPPRTSLVLVTASPAGLLATVRSRCQKVALPAERRDPLAAPEAADVARRASTRCRARRCPRCSTGPRSFAASAHSAAAQLEELARARLGLAAAADRRARRRRARGARRARRRARALAVPSGARAAQRESADDGRARAARAPGGRARLVPDVVRQPLPPRRGRVRRRPRRWSPSARSRAASKDCSRSARATAWRSNARAVALAEADPRVWATRRRAPARGGRARRRGPRRPRALARPPARGGRRRGRSRLSLHELAARACSARCSPSRSAGRASAACPCRSTCAATRRTRSTSCSTSGPPRAAATSAACCTATPARSTSRGARSTPSSTSRSRGSSRSSRDRGLREVAAALPLERLLVETDAPLLAPEGHRGRRNEPARVVRRGRACSRRCTSAREEEVARATTRNARARVPARAASRR